MRANLYFWKTRLADIRKQCKQTDRIPTLVKLNIDAERCMYEIAKWSGA